MIRILEFCTPLSELEEPLEWKTPLSFHQIDRNVNCGKFGSENTNISLNYDMKIQLP
jgi:hypothetical protein